MSGEILEKVKAMNKNEQVELLIQLQEMILEDSDSELEALHSIEAERRIDAYKAGQIKARGIEEVKMKYQ